MRVREQLTSTNRQFIGDMVYETTIFIGPYFHVKVGEFPYHTTRMMSVILLCMIHKFPGLLIKVRG